MGVVPFSVGFFCVGESWCVGCFYRVVTDHWEEGATGFKVLATVRSKIYKILWGSLYSCSF